MKNLIRSLTIILVLFVLITQIGAISAENYANPDDFLANITNLKNGDVITIDAGTAEISKSYEINANNIEILAKGDVTFEAKASDVHFKVTGVNVTISGINFVNFKYKNDDGGAISWTGVGGKIANSTFTNCSSSHYGGAISWYNSGDGKIINSNFTNCTAESGGAIRWYGVNGEISNCNFENCKSNQHGGAIYWDGSANGTVDSCTFIKCSAKQGGAISWLNYYYNGQLYERSDNGTLKDNTFISCEAIDNSIVYNQGYNLTVTGKNGAVIYNEGTIKSPIEVLILNNETIEEIKDFQIELTSLIKTGDCTIIGEGFNFTVNGKKLTSKLLNNKYAANYTVVEDKVVVSGSYLNGEDISYKTAVILGKDNSYKLEAKNLVKYFRNGTQYHVKVTDSKNRPIEDVKLVVVLNCKYFKNLKYTLQTNDDGIATLQINLNPGDYDITAVLGDLKTSTTIKVLPISYKLESKDVLKYFKNDTHYNVKLTDQSGNPIANAIVTVVLNCNFFKGLTYNIKTNDDGIATLYINLNPGNYFITAKYSDKAITNKITVLAMTFKLEAKNLDKYFRNDSHYTVKVTDAHNKVVANKIVVVTLNSPYWSKSVSYNIKTDENGIAMLPINLNPGKYSIKASYEGGSCNSEINVRPILITKSLTKSVNEPANLTAKLLDGKGNPAADKVVTFSIFTKTYTLKTDINGVASLPINLAVANWSITIANPDTGAKEVVRVIVKS